MKCYRCQTNQPPSNFHKNRSKKRGYKDHCKKCVKEQDKACGRKQARRARKRHDRRRATPPWYEGKEINRLYKNAGIRTDFTGIPHVVDHIIPLNHPHVCGLHCLANLQVISDSENSIKSNKFSL